MEEHVSTIKQKIQEAVMICFTNFLLQIVAQGHSILSTKMPVVGRASVLFLSLSL